MTNNPDPFRPGEIVEIKGRQFQIAAINQDGKMIVRPSHIKESNADMMLRLQSVRPVDSWAPTTESQAPKP